MRLLVTGGAGFIGSAFVRRRLAETRDDIVVLDKLTYAGNRANLEPCMREPDTSARLRFVHGDICDEAVVDSLVEGVDAVVNFAAESHVDRSILDAEAFLLTGVIGVHVLLDAVRRHSTRHPVRLLQVSTDEVYGAVEDGLSVEGDDLAPRSPYSAAKAAGELLVRSYNITHNTDVVITRGANTYGPYQYPEKIIPLFITNAMQDQSLPIYGDGKQQRDWLHVNDHADGVGYVLDHGVSGEVYNIAGMGLRTNREVTELILSLLDKPWSLARSVPDRPGHDVRYAMDGSKVARLGWQPSVEFEPGLAETVNWFVANRDWWSHARSGDFNTYYENQYGRRLAESVEA